MWELACLRWHHLGVTDRPSCLHRRQASSHKSLAPTFMVVSLDYLGYPARFISRSVVVCAAVSAASTVC